MSAAPATDDVLIEAEALLLQGLEAARQGELSLAAQAWGRLAAWQIAVPELRAQACFNLGLLWLKSGDKASAQQAFELALQLDEGNHEAREQRALLLAASRDNAAVEAAIAEFEHLAQHAPHVNHHFNLGVLHARQGRPDAAEAHYRAGLALQGEHPETLANLGLMLAEQGDQAAALACLRRAVANAPQHAALQANLGGLLEQTDQLALAAECLALACRLAPTHAQHYCDLGVVRTELRELDAAEQAFRCALECEPDHHQAEVFLAQLLLAQGRYAEGWALHEARFALSASAGRPLRPHTDAPQWRGESLQGKTLLVRAEQGYGDEIQFFRYLRGLRAWQPARVLVLSRPALLSLWQSALADCPEYVCLSMLDEALPAHDLWTTLMSMPQFLDEAPLPPYLQAPTQALPDLPPHPRVGLLWQGNPLHLNDAQRSLPGVEAFAPLFAVNGVHFVSLHREAVQTLLPLHQVPDFLTDFAAAAALINALDLIITVDSAYAHLTGALGKPVWVLVPARRTDWRWGYAGSDSPWYPANMRLFRQRPGEGWGTLMADLATALHAWRDRQESSA